MYAHCTHAVAGRQDMQSKPRHLSAGAQQHSHLRFTLQWPNSAVRGCSWLASSVTKSSRRPCAAAAAASGAAGSGLSWRPDEVELLLDGRIDKCDLVEAFCRAAIQQQGRPREDVSSYMEPAAVQAANKSAAAAQPVFPAWCELMQSIDSTDVIDWSDAENDGWGPSTADRRADNVFDINNGCGGSSGDWQPPAAAAAAVAGNRASRGAVWSGSSRSGQQARVGAMQRGVRHRAVAMCATPSSKESSSKESDAEIDDAPHYEGADSDTLFPPGCLEMDDPGHPTDVHGSKDVQAAVVRPEAKPYMNIKNGRWVPPTKTEAEQMMGALSTMGPDEGV